jgi:two-component system NtrC family sensor kinase
MAAGVAHEVNNPLSGVMLCFRELTTTKEEDEGRSELIEAVETGLIKIQGTMSQLLDLFRTASGERKQADLNGLIRNVLMLNRYQLGKKGIRVVCDLSPAAAGLMLDENRIGQVLINMIFNAAHAMGNGGVLTLRTRSERRYCVVSISDTGKGIPPEVLGRIFEPFYSTKGAQGTGLGLSISKNIIEQHDGTIDVESTVGAGTTFHIKLPLTG